MYDAIGQTFTMTAGGLLWDCTVTNVEMASTPCTGDDRDLRLTIHMSPILHDKTPANEAQGKFLGKGVDTP